MRTMLNSDDYNSGYDHGWESARSLTDTRYRWADVLGLLVVGVAIGWALCWWGMP